MSHEIVFIWSLDVRLRIRESHGLKVVKPVFHWVELFHMEQKFLLFEDQEQRVYASKAKEILVVLVKFRMGEYGLYLAIWLLLFKQRGMQFKPIKGRLFC